MSPWASKRKITHNPRKNFHAGWLCREKGERKLRVMNLSMETSRGDKPTPSLSLCVLPLVRTGSARNFFSGCHRATNFVLCGQNRLRSSSQGVRFRACYIILHGSATSESEKCGLTNLRKTGVSIINYCISVFPG